MKQMTLIAAAACVAISGTAMADENWTGPYVGIQAGAGNFDLASKPVLTNRDTNVFGIHAGYQHDFGKLVVGAEAQIDRIQGFIGTTGDAITLKVRAGYDLGRVQPYAVIASRDVDDNDGTDVDGMGYGVGVDYKINDSLRVGGEFLTFSDLDNGTGVGPSGESNTFSMRLTYGF